MPPSDGIFRVADAHIHFFSDKFLRTLATEAGIEPGPEFEV